MKLTLIVAADKNWAIGKNNDLLYSLPEDMKFFRKTTSENIVVYGLNTLLSFPKQKPLPNRTNIVMAFEYDNKFEELKVAHNVDELFEILNSIDTTDKRIFICGGASIYKLLCDYCDEAFVTKVDAVTTGADAFFPNLDEKENWKLDYATTPMRSTSGYDISFTIYKNNNVIR